MKKHLSILLLSLFAFTACDKDDDYRVREWTVASQLGIAHGAHSLQPVLLVKTGDDTAWRALYNNIEGFSFEAGYEYRLRVKADKIADPPQDGSTVRYVLLEQIAKTPAESDIPQRFYPDFTLEIAPQPIGFHGQQFLGVRFPDAGLYDWQPWPFRIEGFDYQPGYAYKLHVGTSVVSAPDAPEGYYSVQYTLLDVIGKEPGTE